MISGLMAGTAWALETVILGLAMTMTPFISTEQAIFLAPFVSTFLHDLCSALWAGFCNLLHGQLKEVAHAAFKTKEGKYVMLAAIIGGPVGMTGYVLTINQMGSAMGAVASAVFPAIGAVLAFFFLKEKMKGYQWLCLLATLLGVYGLSYSPDLNVQNFWLGIMGALMCAFGWGIEAVILARCMQDPQIKDEYVLQIRQTTSALVHGVVVLPLVGGWGFTAELIRGETGWLLPVLVIAALCATVSYLFYYRAISRIGASRAMALNITYVAWAFVFTVLILKDTSALSMITVFCSVVILICSLLVAVNFDALV